MQRRRSVVSSGAFFFFLATAVLSQWAAADVQSAFLSEGPGHPGARVSPRTFSTRSAMNRVATIVCFALGLCALLAAPSRAADAPTPDKDGFYTLFDGKS